MTLFPPPLASCNNLNYQKQKSNKSIIRFQVFSSIEIQRACILYNMIAHSITKKQESDTHVL